MTFTKFKRRASGDTTAPPEVEGVQYKVKDSFEGKLALLNFIEGKNSHGLRLSITIYGDCLVAQLKKGLMKIGHEDWIVATPDAWFFVGNELFRETYEAIESVKVEHSEGGK